jgi:hypothetical protein
MHENPQYYAGWYLRKIQANLMLNGSALAEQNHSSVVTDLGKHANGVLLKTYLIFCKDKSISQSYVKRMRTLNLHLLIYKSKLGINDENAKKFPPRLLHMTNSSPRNSARVRNSNILLLIMEQLMFCPVAK